VEVREPKALHQDSRNHEVRNPEKVKIFDRSQSFAERFGFHHFGSCEDKRSGFIVLKLPKSRNMILLCRRTWPSILGKSTFQVSEGGKVKNIDNKIREIAKPKIPKREEKESPDKEKGRDHFIVVRGVEWCFVLVHTGAYS
jgi:hypothetical protein